MKNILFIVSFCLFSVMALAQDTWQLAGYEHRSAVSVGAGKRSVEVSNGTTRASFPLVKKGNELRLERPADAARILSVLGIDGAAVGEKYGAGANLSPAEQLVAQAEKQPNGLLEIVPGTEPGGLDSVNDVVADGEEPAGGVEGLPEQSAEGGFNWLYILGGAVALVVITVLVTRSTMPKKVMHEPEAFVEEEPVQKKTGSSQATVKAEELKKLKQQLKSLQATNEELVAKQQETELSLSALQQFDKVYYNEAFRRLVVPMNNALESGSQREMMENMVKIMMHFNSLTRYKISKKQDYDEGNIRFMLNQPSTIAAVEINATTPVDKIPKNIKVLTDMLKQYGSGGLDDSIISGYKIKNI